MSKQGCRCYSVGARAPIFMGRASTTAQANHTTCCTSRFTNASLAFCHVEFSFASLPLIGSYLNMLGNNANKTVSKIAPPLSVLITLWKRRVLNCDEVLKTFLAYFPADHRGRAV
jgi:hypothetical protein